MTSDDLVAWQTQMHLTPPKAASALGVTYATYRDWLAGKSRNTGKPVVISLTTALACAALVAGLEPYHRGNPRHDAARRVAKVAVQYGH